MNIKTAVEILEIKLLGIVSFDSEVLRNKYKEQFKQAKEMEKEQIKDAHLIGLITSMEMEATKQSEQYYNETFKKETK